MSETVAAALKSFDEARAKRGRVKIKKVLPVDVSEISSKGFRVQVLDRDYYLSFERYPWFRDATEAEIREVVCKWESLLCWETLDLDFRFELLDHPEKSVIFCPYVRGVPRLDLFEGFVLPQPMTAQPMTEKHGEKQALVG